MTHLKGDMKKPTKSQMEIRLLSRLSILEKRAAMALNSKLKYERSGNTGMEMLYRAEWHALDLGVWALATSLGIVEMIPNPVTPC